jgi:hypothetical protein
VQQDSLQARAFSHLQAAGRGAHRRKMRRTEIRKTIKEREKDEVKRKYKKTG